MKKIEKKIIIVFYFLISSHIFSQSISHGPVVGGVTESEFKIFVRSTDAVNVEVKASTDPNFNNPISVLSSIDFQKDSSTIITFSGLQPNSTYYYQVLLDGTNVFNNEITTFPPDGQPGNYVFGVGSCVSHLHSQEIMNVVRTHNPLLFIYTGDWGYPDYLYGNSSNLFPSVSRAIESSYHDRYSDPYAKPLLSCTPIDYMYDYHDFVKDNCSGTSYSSVYYNPSSQQTELNEVPYASSVKRSTVVGYSNYFPHYDLPDTSNGVYHSYKMGNAEFFVLDVRYSRTPNTNCFVQDSVGDWVFSPDSTHTMLGTSQKTWLKQALLNSTADWKFIISPVTYNKSFYQLMNLMVFLQDYNLNYNGNTIDGMYLAGVFSDTWTGFPHDREWLYGTCVDNNIDNVIIISGDSHSSAIDDGTNSGFPELMAANLAQQNSRIAFYIDSIYGNSLFNAGGQGLGNNNFNYTFGKVEIFGSDSCQLSLIDQYDTQVASHTILGNPTSSNPNFENKLDLKLYPNPAKDMISLIYPEKFEGLLQLFNSYGELVKELDVNFRNRLDIEINSLDMGLYFLRLKKNKNSSYTSRYFIVLD